MTDFCIVSKHGLVHRRSCQYIRDHQTVRGVSPLQARVYQLPYCTKCLTVVQYESFKWERV